MMPTLQAFRWWGGRSAILLTAAFLCPCAAASGQSQPRNELARNIQGACREWQRGTSILSTEQRETLRHFGILSYHDPSLSASFLFSNSMIEDCGVRGYMAQYFERVIAGKQRSADREFAKAYAGKIVEVLWRVWPSLGGSSVAAPGDGAFDQEKYALLTQREMADELIAPLIAHVVLIDEKCFPPYRG